MICPSCKRELPQDSKYCQFCGCMLTSLTVSSRNNAGATTRAPKNKKHSAWVALLSVVLSIVLIFAGIYWGTYYFAKRAAVDCDFSKAYQLLFLPSVTQMHDQQLVEYVNAGKLYEQEKYSEAKTAFDSLDGYLNSEDFDKAASYYEALEQLARGDLSGYKTIAALSKSNFTLATNGLEEAKKQAYDHAVSLYREEDITGAASFFKELKGYRRSNDYMTLINSNSFSELKKLIGFENADEILLNQYADQFLMGTWKNKDGKYYFSIEKNDDGSFHSHYNLPSVSLEHSFYNIADGIYYLYDQDTSLTKLVSGDYERKNLFRFTIIDADTINVYCYKDGSIYNLLRQ